MRDEFVDIILVFIFAIAGLMVIIAPIVWLANWYDSAQCDTYSQVTGRDTKYRTGMCYIKDGDTWYAWQEYKLRNATTGGKQ